MIPIFRSTDVKSVKQILRSGETQLKKAEAAARRILSDVRREGDRALKRWTLQLDKVDLAREGFAVKRREVVKAYRQVPEGFADAVQTSARNIRKAAREQLPRSWQISNGPGIKVSQIVRPLGRVACYVPGGRFPLPSTVLMSVIPAQVAGVGEIFITSPRPAPAVLVAADILGIKKIFRLGGAQAIGAFAYGTESIPRADKIVGPGNRYVAAAKKLVAGDCGIDFVAGPSELMVVASEGNARWIASDLVAQAEHDPDAVAIFLTPSRKLALEVQGAVERILEEVFAREGGVPTKALNGHGAVVVTKTLEEAIDLVNAFAPEHLSLLGAASRMLDRVRSAGSIFLGETSPVAAGDYASGTNHILPTAGAARLRGGLSTADFVKTISVQKLTPQGLARIRKTITTLARTEGLKAHAYSIETRFKVHGSTPKGR
ncbi:MAG: histidinol dehydrogenase [Acidobacteria bacterium]|nr:MAG: histidinol dehydrogenase [Acidobacteriota bacterium]